MGVRIREKKKGSGIWWVFINRENKRISRRIGRRSAAEAAAEQIEAKLKLGQEALPKQKSEEDEPIQCPTLCEWYEGYQTRILGGLREATRRSYAESFKRILPAFGKKPLDQITRFKIQIFIAELLREDLSWSTIRLICAALCTVLNDAVEHEQIVKNPALKLSKLYRNARKPKKVEPFDAPEVTRILQATSRLCPAFYPVLLFVLHTGARSGEAAGLTWDDIDFDAHQINISGAVSRYQRNNPAKGETKTATDKKPIDMSETLETELKAQRQRLKTLYLKKGQNKIPRWVFPNSRGGAFDIENFKKRWWKRILEEARVTYRAFHQTRHTVACLLLMNGKSLVYVRDMFAHASISVTADIYARWIKLSDREAVNSLTTVCDEVQVEAVGG
jgi:integrase